VNPDDFVRVTTFKKFHKGRLDNEHHYLENTVSEVVVTHIGYLGNDEIMWRQVKSESLLQLYRLSVYQRGS